MFCCVLAAFTLKHPPVPVQADSLEEAISSCNRMTSVIEEGFSVMHSESPGMYLCQHCSSLFSPVAGLCTGANVVDSGYKATRIYSDDVDISRRDYCTNIPGRGWECLACTKGQSVGALRPPATSVVHISSDCHHLVHGGRTAVGALNLESSHITVNGYGGIIMFDAFPIHVGENLKIDNATICHLNTTIDECLDARFQAYEAMTAMILTKDGTLELNDVHSPTTKALITVRPEHARKTDVRLSRCVISGSSGSFVGAFANVKFDDEFDVVCSDSANRLLFQTRRNIIHNTSLQITNCDMPIAIADLISAYGDHYEIAFMHNKTERRTASQLVKTTTQLLIYAIIALSVVLIFGHEGDIRRLIAKQRRSGSL